MLITPKIREAFDIRGEAWIDTSRKVSYYRVMVANRKHRYLHRLIYEFHYGEIPKGMMIDHLDGNGLNCCIDNMVIKDAKGNARNSRKRSDNKSGHVGVSWNEQRKKWFAQGSKNSKTVPLGRYDNLNDAVEARKAWQELQGDFTDRHGT